MSLTDKQSFDYSCEYRALIKNPSPSGGLNLLINPVFFTGNRLVFLIDDKNPRQGYIDANNKSLYVNIEGNASVIYIKKRCVINQTPQGQISWFNLPTCPAGWKLHAATITAPSTGSILCEKE